MAILPGPAMGVFAWFGLGGRQEKPLHRLRLVLLHARYVAIVVVASDGILRVWVASLGGQEVPPRHIGPGRCLMPFNSRTEVVQRGG